MISIEKMIGCERKNIRLKAINGRIFEDYCYCYLQAEDEDEEPALEIGERWLISQSSIESIEILD